jgi:Rrf2 family transcriptional regulator, iron-sulfur cluster assembly transcription factor
MIYSTACEYAIRAAVFLAARPLGERVKVREIAEAEGIPGPFLSSVLQKLVSAELLLSARGPNGGYALARSGDEIVLHDLKVAVDGAADLESCAVGLGTCSDDRPCPLHESWKPVRERIRAYLRETTLQEMVVALEAKRNAMDPEDAPTPPRTRSRFRTGKPTPAQNRPDGAPGP